MAYTLTPADTQSITDVEMAFSTNRLLPPWEDIPAEFKTGNDYTVLVEALMYGKKIPEGEVVMLEGFEPSDLDRTVHAHLQSFAHKHEHKIAGVAFLVSLACTVKLEGGAP